MESEEVINEKTQDTQDCGVGYSDNQINKELVGIKDSISSAADDIEYLRDLFIRRLNEDKQKNLLIQKLAEGATFSYVEPFLHDIILLLDRLGGVQDEFAQSVYEELYDIINRRGVEKIIVGEKFDPSLYKAVKVTEDPKVQELTVAGIIRDGYKLSGKVIRPAEVSVIRPKKSEDDNKEDN